MIPKSKLFIRVLCFQLPPLPSLFFSLHRVTIFINFQIRHPFFLKRKKPHTIQTLPESIRILSVKQNHCEWYRRFIVGIRHYTILQSWLNGLLEPGPLDLAPGFKSAAPAVGEEWCTQSEESGSKPAVKMHWNPHKSLSRTGNDASLTSSLWLWWCGQPAKELAHFSIMWQVFREVQEGGAGAVGEAACWAIVPGRPTMMS